VTTPQVKTLFRPWMSARRPKGTRKIAAARTADVATQLKVTASKENSSPIAGRAMFTEEPMKGVRKELPAAAARAAIFWEGSSVIPGLGYGRG